jgi:hypothetical protein
VGRSVIHHSGCLLTLPIQEGSHILYFDQCECTGRIPPIATWISCWLQRVILTSYTTLISTGPHGADHTVSDHFDQVCLNSLILTDVSTCEPIKTQGFALPTARLDRILFTPTLQPFVTTASVEGDPSDHRVYLHHELRN